MDVCSVPLLQQLSLKTPSTRAAEGPSYSDLSDGEQHTVKARRYSGVFSPSKRASSQEEAPEVAAAPAWTPDDSSALYNIPGWGAEYFQASPDGHLLVAPQGGERSPTRPPAAGASQHRMPAADPGPRVPPAAQRRGPSWTCMR